MTSNPYRTPTVVHEAPASELARSGSVISSAWSMVAANAFVLLGCYLVVWLPVDLVTAYTEFHYIDSDDFRTSFHMQQTVDLFFGTIATGAIYCAAGIAFRNSKPTLPMSLYLGLKRWPKLLTTRICVGMIGTFGLLLLIFPGLYFFVRALYAGAIAVEENVHGPTAIRRSFEVSRGRFWETVALSLTVMAVWIVGTIALMTMLTPLYFWEGPLEGIWAAEAILGQGFAFAEVLAGALIFCGYRHARNMAGRDASAAPSAAEGESA